MWFNIFRHKEKKEVPSKTVEGKFISDEEFEELIRPKTKSIVKQGLEEIDEMMKELKEQIDSYGRE